MLGARWRTVRRFASLLRLSAWLTCGLCTTACGGARIHEAPPAKERLARSWTYDVTLDPKLERVVVSMCFRGPTPRELRPGKDSAAPHLVYARLRSAFAVERLEVRDGLVQLGRQGDDACVEYAVSLHDHMSMDAAVRHVGSDVIASPNVWLYRPERRSVRATAELRIHLPKGVHASLPWPRKGDHYVLDAETFRFDSYAAFGRFRKVTIEHRGVRIDAAILDGPLAVDEGGIARWLSSAVDVSATLDGMFPTQYAQLIIAPSGAYDDPVQFGAVARGGSGSIMLFVSSTASEQALVTDWVLPHELSHLCLPFVRRDDAWLPEGLATYYQEVLRARAGVVSEQEILAGMVKALDSASQQGTGRSLAEESRAMYQTYAFRAVYWGGAAFFLLADVALRERSGGKQSLDWLLMRLRAEPAPETLLSASELLLHMERLSGLGVLLPLAERVLSSPFPSYAPTLRALGVIDDAGSPKLRDDAPLAHIRRDIFAQREDTSPILGARASR